MMIPLLSMARTIDEELQVCEWDTENLEYDARQIGYEPLTLGKQNRSVALVIDHCVGIPSRMPRWTNTSVGSSLLEGMK